MHVYFNRPKKLKKKAYISIAKFTGFSVPFCCHVYSPYLFIFQRPLTPLNPVIPVFLAHGQTLLKNTLWTALYLALMVHRQTEQFKFLISNTTSAALSKHKLHSFWPIPLMCKH